uniref:Acetylcholine receptor subunit beta n=1 Tax=Cyclopterus lumpus TaxID=8103 RepID=A0A8C3G090_CYCLU
RDRQYLIEKAMGASDVEKSLMKTLFTGYNLKVRPAASAAERVVVRVGMVLSSFVGLNMKNEEMSTTVFMNLEWTDYRLSWKPKEHDGIEVMRFPAGKVWLPDIVLINNNNGVFDVALHVHVQAYSNGRVTWTPPALYCSSCGVKVEYFPFDWQNCTMQFRSYTYDSTEINVQYALDSKGNEIKEIQLDEAYTEGGEWHITHRPCRKNMNDDLYEDMTFYLIIERKPLYYVFNIIVPCILITIIAIFNFYLPPDAGEKMGLSINVLLTLTVFLLLLADKIPETSLGVPIIVNYIMFTMILVTFSVILSVVVLNLHHRSANTHRMPIWVRKIFIHLLPPYLGMLRPKVETPLSLEIMPPIVRFLNSSLFSFHPFCLLPPPPTPLTSHPLLLPPSIHPSTLVQLKEDWQYVAMVVDRMFLWIFVVFTTVGTLAIFADASFNHTPTDPFKAP